MHEMSRRLPVKFGPLGPTDAEIRSCSSDLRIQGPSQLHKENQEEKDLYTRSYQVPLYLTDTCTFIGMVDICSPIPISQVGG